jgi:hypothetical protein
LRAIAATATSLIAPPLAALKKYERRISAASMVGGFAFDNYYFGRVDHPATQIVLALYLVTVTAALLSLHYTQSHAEREGLLRKARTPLIGITQFALGGLWSAFLILYGRSAVFIASWPFLILLAAMLIGNEMFRHYQQRLAFTCTLLFLALYSYAIFAIPVVTGSMGRGTFIVSGIIATVAFGVVLYALDAIGRERIRASWKGIALGAAGVLTGLNLFYFLNILPPLPLALANAGVFHSVAKVGNVYRATGEPTDWWSRFGFNQTVHIDKGEPLSVYSAVFAPIALKTNIVHIWQRYDEASGAWRTESTVTFPITGGREGGYRLYSIKSRPQAGQWRVAIQTPEGLLIGRIGFLVAEGADMSKRFLQIIE